MKNNSEYKNIQKSIDKDNINNKENKNKKDTKDLHYQSSIINKNTLNILEIWKYADIYDIIAIFIGIIAAIINGCSCSLGMYFLKFVANDINNIGIKNIEDV